MIILLFAFTTKVLYLCQFVGLLVFAEEYPKSFDWNTNPGIFSFFEIAKYEFPLKSSKNEC